MFTCLKQLCSIWTSINNSSIDVNKQVNYFIRRVVNAYQNVRVLFNDHVNPCESKWRKLIFLRVFTTDKFIIKNILIFQLFSKAWSSFWSGDQSLNSLPSAKMNFCIMDIRLQPLRENQIFEDCKNSYHFTIVKLHYWELTEFSSNKAEKISKFSL